MPVLKEEGRENVEVLKLEEGIGSLGPIVYLKPTP